MAAVQRRGEVSFIYVYLHKFSLSCPFQTPTKSSQSGSVCSISNFLSSFIPPSLFPHVRSCVSSSWRLPPIDIMRSKKIQSERGQNDRTTSQEREVKESNRAIVAWRRQGSIRTIEEELPFLRVNGIKIEIKLGETASDHVFSHFLPAPRRIAFFFQRGGPEEGLRFPGLVAPISIPSVHFLATRFSFTSIASASGTPISSASYTQQVLYSLLRHPLSGDLSVLGHTFFSIPVPLFPSSDITSSLPAS